MQRCCITQTVYQSTNRRALTATLVPAAPRAAKDQEAPLESRAGRASPAIRAIRALSARRCVVNPCLNPVVCARLTLTCAAGCTGPSRPAWTTRSDRPARLTVRDPDTHQRDRSPSDANRRRAVAFLARQGRRGPTARTVRREPAKAAAAL